MTPPLPRAGRSGKIERAPSYFDDRYKDRFFAKAPRVLAAAGGYKLYAYISPSGGLSFDLGDTGVGMGFESARELGSRAVYVLGPGSMQYADEHGHVPLFGVAASSVKSVELSYESGPPLRLTGVEGGFVLLVEPDRGPRDLTAFDTQGNRVARQSIDYEDGVPNSNSWDRYVRPSPNVRSHP